VSLRVLQAICGLKQQHHAFAKHNDRNSAARPLAYLPTKLLKQGFDVPPRQAAAYRSGEDQLKGALCFRFITA
jgi:hypothetical protein